MQGKQHPSVCLRRDFPRASAYLPAMKMNCENQGKYRRKTALLPLGTHIFAGIEKKNSAAKRMPKLQAH